MRKRTILQEKRRENAMKEESLEKKWTDFDESLTLWSGEREEKESQMPDFELNYRRVDRF